MCDLLLNNCFCFRELVTCIANKIANSMRSVLVFVLGFLIAFGGFCQVEDPYKSKRLSMVRFQISNRGVLHKETIRAMQKVPRHLFVPQAYIRNAYEDRPIPIGYGQTISQPYIVAFMTEQSKAKEGKVALEIGTGSGYQAAVLAEIVDSVFTVEIVNPLGLNAKELFDDLNYNNVVVKIGDGYFGWKEKGPFDIILVTAAADHIPPSLIEQLKEGGRMLIPVGSPFLVQQLMLVEKRNGKVVTRSLLPVRFVPFTRSP